MKNGILSIIKSGLNSCVKLFLEVFIFDRKKRRILKGKFCQWYLKHYIQDVEKQGIKFSENVDNNYKIWQYWNTGLENAPDIVKVCINSVRKYTEEFEYVMLNDNNIKEYVNIPDYIYELRERGIISNAHFADILRTYLLYEHGGCWIDATVFLTAPLNKKIVNSELFVLQNNQEEDPDYLKMTNYFMSSQGKSFIIAKMKQFLENYWRNNSFVINYFFYAHAFTLFTESSEENKKEWDAMFNFSYIPVQQMERELLNNYSPERFNELKSSSSIHKLSYKWKVIAGKKKNASVEGTLYQHIINSLYSQPNSVSAIPVSK